MVDNQKIHYKWLTVSEMKDIIKNMPDDYRLIPNTVGNLKVEDENGNYVGFIDFIDGTFEKV